ncbi:MULTISPECIES: hypothetical protein [unclassified Streptomyces]|uniref:hypothetical protein n=1 Tax=unclassified Streptomyces TaxID=2593676 RepID=UPI000CD59A09|nr:MULTISPECIES: hypothetical protein [unclassified Streptomyces]
MTDTFSTAADAARAAGEAVRVVNHLTIRASAAAEWEMPGDAYTVVGALAALAERLPQSLDQSAALVDRLNTAGRLRHDSGDDDQLRVDAAAFAIECREAAVMAGQLADSLQHALAALGRIGYREEGGAR